MRRVWFLSVRVCLFSRTFHVWGWFFSRVVWPIELKKKKKEWTKHLFPKENCGNLEKLIIWSLRWRYSDMHGNHIKIWVFNHVFALPQKTFFNSSGILATFPDLSRNTFITLSFCKVIMNHFLLLYMWKLFFKS